MIQGFTSLAMGILGSDYANLAPSSDQHYTVGVLAPPTLRSQSTFLESVFGSVLSFKKFRFLPFKGVFRELDLEALPKCSRSDSRTLSGAKQIAP